MNKIVVPRAKLAAAGVGFAVLVSLFAFTIAHALSTSTTWYVNSGTLACSDTGSGTSANPFCSIQAAVTAAGTTSGTIQVAAGTYNAFKVVGASNLTIQGAGAGSTIIVPTALIDTGIGHKYTPDMLASVFVNGSTNVTLLGMTIKDNGKTPGSGGPDALLFWNASSGSIQNAAIAGTYAINGVQSGQGIAVDAGSGQTANLSVQNVAISGFQKNGIDAVDGNYKTSNPGTITLSVQGGSITGAGSTGTIAQNGILVWNQGGGNVTGTVNGTAISNLQYTPTPEDAGVLAYGGATITSVAHVAFSNVDTYISNSSTGGAIDATSGNTFGGISPASATPTQLATIENGMDDLMSDNSAGLVYILPKTLIVTNATDNRGIQVGLNAAPAAGTVLVTPGTYAGDVMVPASSGLTLAGVGSPVINLADGYGINLDNNVAVTGFTMSGFTVNASPSTTYALKAHMANGLTLANDTFNGGSGNTGGGVDLNTTSNVTLNKVTATGFHKNGFAYTPQFQNSDTAASGITFNNVTASNNGWTGISFYTVGNDHSTSNPSTIGGTHSITGVTFTGTNTVSGNGAGIHIEGDSDAHEATASTPANTVTTDGTTLDLSHVAFAGNVSYDVINYQTAPVNAIGATFDPGAITGDAMSAAQRTVEDGKIIDQLDHAAYGLVTYYHNTGNLVINNYICPAGTTVTRSVNGVGGTVPAGCVPGAGTTFGYVHGTQTDANPPDPELGQTLTVIGTTNTSGTLTISLPATGRYLVAETDLHGNQLPANAPLGLYCTGDGDTSTTNDNQELTFVPSAGTTNCVAYDLNPLAAPTNLTPADGTITADQAFNDTWSPVIGAVAYQYETSYSAIGGVLGTVIYSDGSPSNGNAQYPSNGNYTITSSLVTRGNNHTPDQAYYWHVRAVDQYGNVGPWSVISKVTVDTDSVTTNPANPIHTTDATLNGTVGATNADNTSFWWGTTPISGTLVAGTDPGSSEFPASGWQHDNGLGAISAGQPFSKQVTGLSPNTLYYFVAWAQINGQWTPGSVESFTTTNGSLPSVTTNDASGVGLTTATLNGTDGPIAADDTSFWWGTTPISGTLVAGSDPGSTSEFPAATWKHDSGLGSVAASGALTEALTGLALDTQYYFVAWVKSAGTWYPGNVKSFTTSSASPQVHIYSYVDNALATAAGTNSAVFPMETTWTSSSLGNQSNIPFTLSPTGWGSTDSAYEASYVGGANGDNYSAWEVTNGSVVATDCSTGAPYALVGYTTGPTLAAAQSATRSATVPAFTNLQNDQYMIVWNKTCAPLPPVAGVTTEAATNVSNADATLNGMNGGIAADAESFWVSKDSTFDLSAPNTIPSDAVSTQVITDPASIAAGGAFSASLASVATQGIPTNLAITPSTTYYYVAWSHVNGQWYPGAIKQVTTSAAPVLPVPTATAQSVNAGENKPLVITLAGTGSGAISFATSSNPMHGTLAGIGSTLTYTPDAGYTGSDSFTFTANNGTASAPATVSITVLPPPTLTVKSNNPAKIKLNSTYSDQGAIVTAPAADTNLTVLASVDGGATTTISGITVSTSATGTHTVFYSATDSFGNIGTASRTVIVSGPPVITLNGDATLNLTVGDAYIEQGATATDLADGTDTVTIGGDTVNTATAGTYHVTYNATDSLGQSAAQVTRTIIVSAAPAPQQTQSFSVSGNGPVVGTYGSLPLGQVLGASTSTVSTSTKPDTTKLSCSTPLLSQYMRMGKANDPAQVKLLQTFLNGNMDAGLSVSGYFGIATQNAVKAFQTKYASTVLTPWKIADPTGYVYKTTEWQINELNCSTLNAPFPTL